MDFKEAFGRMAYRVGASIAGMGKSWVQPSLLELGLSDGEVSRLPKPGFGNYDKYLQAYADEGWVYSCVSRRSQDVAAAPIKLFSKRTKKWVETHPVLDLLDRPNSEMNRRGLLEWTCSSMLLTGNGYWKYEDVGTRGIPGSLWPIIPSMVEVMPGPSTKQMKLGYAYHHSGKRDLWGVEEVLQFMMHNPTSYFYGLPPLAAARLSVDTHRAASKWNLRFFDNAARPDMVFETPHSLQPEQRKRMAASWNARHKGEDKAHNVAFLEKGTVAKLVGINQKDMDFVLQKKMSREEICSVFKTPPAIVGLFEYASYANAEEQEKIYQRSTVVPDAQLVCDFLNERFLPLFDTTGQLLFMVDRSEIKALQEDEKVRAEYVGKYWGMGVPLNQLVKSYTLPFGEVPGSGSVSYIAQGAVPADQAGVQQPTPPEPPKAAPELDEEPVAVESAKAASMKSRLKAKHNRFLLLADRLGGPMRTDVRAFFDAQRDKALAALASGVAYSISGLGLDLHKERAALAAILSPHLDKSLVAGIKSENLFIKDFTKRDAPQASEKALGRKAMWVEKNAFAWAGDINATTFTKLEKALQVSVEEGEGMAETAKRVAEVFDVERDYRTLRIAQTEVIAALNEGANEAYRENDQIAGKGWLATLDEATRDTHVDAGRTYSGDGAIGVDEDFHVGSGSGPTPGQIGLPEEDCNCRCSIFPVVKKA